MGFQKYSTAIINHLNEFEIDVGSAESKNNLLALCVFGFHYKVVEELCGEDP